MMLPVPARSEGERHQRRDGGDLIRMALDHPGSHRTIQSMPPAACISAAAVTTARMMSIAEPGGSPAVRRTRTPAPRTETAPEAHPDTTGTGAHDDRTDDDQCLEYEDHTHLAVLSESPCGGAAQGLPFTSCCTPRRSAAARSPTGCGCSAGPPAAAPAPGRPPDSPPLRRRPERRPAPHAAR